MSLVTNLSIPEAPRVSPEDYILDRPFISMRLGGRLNAIPIFKCDDGTEWVHLTNNENNKEEDRFCGFLYLKKSLYESKYKDSVMPAESKITILKRKIIYLSRYCGEEKPSLGNMDVVLTFRKVTGYTESTGNMRIENGKLYVFDTEKSSFDPCVHGKINAFFHVHRAIRSVLEERLEKSRSAEGASA